MKEALMIFVRNPEAGKVKTRLAAQIGNEKTLQVYKKLLAHTYSVAKEMECDVFVFTTERLQDTQWNQFIIANQQGDSLGAKMENAFEFVFEKGYKKAVIIGSDCPGIEASHVRQAFKILDTSDLVIGPATDGGYYLLGMKKLHRHLFQNRTWSTATVLTETISSINAAGLSFSSLVTLTDVDEEKDLPPDWREEFLSTT